MDDFNPPEKFITLKQAAEALGIQPFKIRKAAKGGNFPVYRIGNSRALCLLSEVRTAAVATCKGGGNE